MRITAGFGGMVIGMPRVVCLCYGRRLRSLSRRRSLAFSTKLGDIIDLRPSTRLIPAHFCLGQQLLRCSIKRVIRKRYHIVRIAHLRQLP